MWLWRVICLKKSSCNKEVICPARNCDFVPAQLANKLEEGRLGDRTFLLVLCSVHFVDLLINWFNYVDGRLLGEKAKLMFTCGDSC